MNYLQRFLCMRKKRKIRRSKSGSRSSEVKLTLRPCSSSVVAAPTPSSSHKLTLRPCSSVVSKSCQSITFCITDFDDKLYWFKADISGGKDEYFGKTKKRKRGVGHRYHVLDHSAENLEPYSKANISPFGTCVALGSALYCIGGNCGKRGRVPNTLRYVRCVDFGLGESEWKRVGRMINARHLPRIAAIDGKLYVFGGLFKDRKPWAEVYDPRLNRWEALYRPPSRIPRNELCTIALPHSKKILVLGLESNRKYIYDVKTGYWDYFLPLIKIGLWFGGPVAVENTLYFMDPYGQVCAYDIDQGKFFSGFIQGLEDEQPFIKEDSRLLHLSGQIFCLVWYVNDGDFTRFHFSKIRVYKETNLSETKIPGDLIANFESCQCYRVHGHLCLKNAQLLDMRLDEDLLEMDAFREADAGQPLETLFKILDC